MVRINLILNGPVITMEFKIATPERKNVPFFPISTPSASNGGIPGAKGIEATGHFGSMRFFEIECPAFSIWYSNYEILKRTHLYGTMDGPALELHFTINNTVHYKLEGLNETTLLQGQFNMSYAPIVNIKAWFQKDETYTTFHIHFSREYLQKIATYFPVLAGFMQNVEQGIAAMLSRQHGQTTPEMSSIIRNILRCPYTGDIRNLYLQAKVLELLILALEQLEPRKTKTPDIVLRPYDIEKIREAHDYLLRNMDNPCTLVELSHKVGINDFKLKKGFKQLYGTTVYEFLVDARMEKAKTLLLETDTSIHEIAFVTGYKNLSSFITAFKKKMGYSPGSYKRMKRGSGV